MKKNCFQSVILVLIGLLCSCKTVPTVDHSLGNPESPAADLSVTKRLRPSLVYIESTIRKYDTLQPWKQTVSQTLTGCGTAVGFNQIITPADLIANASLIRVRIYGRNEYLPADIKTVDYDLNLCFLEIPQEALKEPLASIDFYEDFSKGSEINMLWLSSMGEIKSSRGIMDRAVVASCPTSYQRTLRFILSTISRPASSGEICLCGDKAIGIAFSSTENEIGLIPGETINRFLSQVGDSEYIGFGTPGFETFDLIDPEVRSFLKMPDEMKNGVYVSNVYSRGCGSDVLRTADAILSIDNIDINAYGRYIHPSYEDISLEHLIQKHSFGDSIHFRVWRDGAELDLETKVTNFKSSEMLVPYQEYDMQPEFYVTAGYVFQKLNRDYFLLWGDNWSGKVPPHLFHYYRDLSLKPTEERKEIVVLSYVLPATLNLGYQQLGRVVVKSVNGIELKGMDDLKMAFESESDSPFHVVEFEMDYPTLVIPKENLKILDQQIQQLYGVQTLLNIR